MDSSWHEFLADYHAEATPGEPPPSAMPETASLLPRLRLRPPSHPQRRPRRSPPLRLRLRLPPRNRQPRRPPSRNLRPRRQPPRPQRAVAGAPGSLGSRRQNMNASLAIPTATSVRAIPATLMIDNRIVINNHLKRTRGGKISFTHLLGYALVQAVKKFPNMNRFFAEIDGKPNVVTPAHTNLGLAIDLPGKDGKRSLVVAGHQGLRDHGLR